MIRQNVVYLFLFLWVATGAAATAAERPTVFWASDPVRPDETVLLAGSDLESPETIVEMARYDDTEMPAALAATNKLPAELPPGAWRRVPVLQASDQSLKCLVPADWQPGVFACRVTTVGGTSQPVVLNAPDAWWIQADDGPRATPGGWLRLLGKSLSVGPGCRIRLEPEQGPPVELAAINADGFSARFDLPPDLAGGAYRVRVHNGLGGPAAWRVAGRLDVAAPPGHPNTVFNVLDSYGPEAATEMRKSLLKYVQPIDRTEGIRQALDKARQNGGGVVYFPAGRYAVKGQLTVPDHTVLKGEGMGVVTVWWGTGHFNLDGGGPQGRAPVAGPKAPEMLIFGSDYGLEDMSFYFPLDYEQGIVADHRLRMHRVRVRVDHAWLLAGPGEGTAVRMGGNFQVTDCDIFAKGAALKLGKYGLVAHNRVLAKKINTELGGSENVIVEDNEFVSQDPTAYQNIAGQGRNIYYARNRHESQYVHQADYSFTFDAAGGAYFGRLTEARGAHLTLAADPTYPQWAPEKSDLWRHSVVCILAGRGAGQWRDVVANHGRQWEVDRPFDVPPDPTSVLSIAGFNGRALIIGNRFEDAAWVNAGYGMSIEVICAENTLVRTGIMLNHGVQAEDWFEPSWYVQFLDNRITEGHTQVESLGVGQRSPLFAGPLTRFAVHRRNTLAADNSGSITIHGNIADVIVEGCTLNHPMSVVKVADGPQGVLLRNNRFAGQPAPRYEGDALDRAVVLPPLPAKP